MRLLALVLVLGACSGSSCSKPSAPAPPPPPPEAASPCPPSGSASGGDVPSTVIVVNTAPDDTVVAITFGPNSMITAASWSFCQDGSAPACVFPLKGRGASRALPIGSQYLNATLVFGAPTVGCGTTKAELNVNNPIWHDVVDVSLVDGYSNGVAIEVAPSGGDGAATKLGPPVGAASNEKVFGLFPVGCDICVARDQPACGMPVGKDGCKGGTQYDPDVPCQYQGPARFGGLSILVEHVGTPL